MKVLEICKKENVGKMYKDNNGDKWEVTKWEDSNGIHKEYDIKCVKNRRDITDDLFLSEIIKMDFEEVVDWGKVSVDTKILISGDNKDWDRRHFANYEDGKIYTWIDACTSSTTNQTTSWKYAKLYKEEEE